MPRSRRPAPSPSAHPALLPAPPNAYAEYRLSALDSRSGRWKPFGRALAAGSGKRYPDGDARGVFRLNSARVQELLAPRSGYDFVRVELCELHRNAKTGKALRPSSPLFPDLMATDFSNPHWQRTAELWSRPSADLQAGAAFRLLLDSGDVPAGACTLQIVPRGRKGFELRLFLRNPSDAFEAQLSGGDRFACPLPDGLDLGAKWDFFRVSTARIENAGICTRTSFVPIPADAAPTSRPRVGSVGGSPYGGGGAAPEPPPYSPFGPPLLDDDLWSQLPAGTNDLVEYSFRLLNSAGKDRTNLGYGLAVGDRPREGYEAHHELVRMREAAMEHAVNPNSPWDLLHLEASPVAVGRTRSSLRIDEPSYTLDAPGFTHAAWRKAAGRLPTAGSWYRTVLGPTADFPLTTCFLYLGSLPGGYEYRFYLSDPAKFWRSMLTTDRLFPLPLGQGRKRRWSFVRSAAPPPADAAIVFQSAFRPRVDNVDSNPGFTTRIH